MKLSAYVKFVIASSVAFLLIRLPSLALIYHQDEYKWARTAEPRYGLAWTIPHPPFAELLYILWGKFVGYEWLRVPPLIFALAAFILSITLVHRWYGRRTSVVYAACATISSVAILASTQIDIDGSFLVFWTVLTLLGYTNLKQGITRRGKILFALGLVGGFLTKLSFFLVPAALIIDHFWDIGSDKLKRWHVVTLVAVIGSGIIALNTSLFDHILFLAYVKRFGFLNFHRNYQETAFLTLKSIVLFGPVLLLSAYGALKNAARYRLLLVFGALQFAFYYVLFDFSGRTLERYLLVFIFPALVIAGDTIAELLPAVRTWWNARTIGLSAATLAGFFLVWTLPKKIIPLNPKEQFITLVKHLDFSFFIPITGGSGPIGFFVPADLTLYAFAIIGALLAYGAWKGADHLKRYCLPACLLLVTLFSLHTSSELLLGWQYGNASRIAKQALVSACQTSARHFINFSI